MTSRANAIISALGTPIGILMLLLIRDPDRLGGDRAADEAGEQYHSQNVRQHLDELHRHFAEIADTQALQTDRDRIEETEHQARAEHRQRSPFAEDKSRKRDEALAGGHVAAEGGVLRDREISAGDPG